MKIELMLSISLWMLMGSVSSVCDLTENHRKGIYIKTFRETLEWFNLGYPDFTVYEFENTESSSIYHILYFPVVNGIV